MSTQQHSTKPTHSEHGTTKSYVIGFILSLILTINPYLLVTSKAVTGNGLVVTILIFGILQMAVQVLFFLHLGRGPKPMYNVVFFFATVGIILVTIGGSIFIMNNLYSNMSPAEVTKKLAQDENIAQVGGVATGACEQVKTNHQVVMKDGTVSPSTVTAKLCDTLTFINEDGSAHNIAFGTYPVRARYSGETGGSVQKNYTKTYTLNTVGTYTFYDYNNPTATGTFTVAQ